MKVKAKSLVGKSLVGTIIWVLGVVVFNVLLFLIFGESRLTISAACISIAGLGLRAISLFHIAFCALTDKEIELTDDEAQKQEGEEEQPKETLCSENPSEESLSGSKEVADGESQSESEGSAALGYLIFLVLGIGLTWLGVSNLSHEMSIFTTKRAIRSRGASTTGVILSCEPRYRQRSRGRSYTYYEHTVQFDHFTQTFTRPDPIRPGTKVPVLYLPENKDKSLIGKPLQTDRDLRQQWGSVVGLAFGLVVYSVLILVGIGCFALLLVPIVRKVVNT